MVKIAFGGLLTSSANMLILASSKTDGIINMEIMEESQFLYSSAEDIGNNEML
jgi:hypothetical protein